MTRLEFSNSLAELIGKAYESGMDIGDVYESLNFQTIYNETLLRVTIEKAYNERFDL